MQQWGQYLLFAWYPQYRRYFGIIIYTMKWSLLIPLTWMPTQRSQPNKSYCGISKNEQMNHRPLPKQIWIKLLKYILLIICIISVINITIELSSLLRFVLNDIIIADNVDLIGVFWTKSCLYLAFLIMSLCNALCLIHLFVLVWFGF